MAKEQEITNFLKNKPYDRAYLMNFMKESKLKNFKNVKLNEISKRYNIDAQFKKNGKVRFLTPEEGRRKAAESQIAVAREKMPYISEQYIRDYYKDKNPQPNSKPALNSIIENIKKTYQRDTSVQPKLRRPLYLTNDKYKKLKENQDQKLAMESEMAARRNYLKTLGKNAPSLEVFSAFLRDEKYNTTERFKKSGKIGMNALANYRLKIIPGSKVLENVGVKLEKKKNLNTVSKVPTTKRFGDSNLGFQNLKLNIQKLGGKLETVIDKYNLSIAQVKARVAKDGSVEKFLEAVNYIESKIEKQGKGIFFKKGGDIRKSAVQMYVKNLQKNEKQVVTDYTVATQYNVNMKNIKRPINVAQIKNIQNKLKNSTNDNKNAAVRNFLTRPNVTVDQVVKEVENRRLKEKQDEQKQKFIKNYKNEFGVTNKSIDHTQESYNAAVAKKRKQNFINKYKKEFGVTNNSIDHTQESYNAAVAKKRQELRNALKKNIENSTSLTVENRRELLAKLNNKGTRAEFEKKVKQFEKDKKSLIAKIEKSKYLSENQKKSLLTLGNNAGLEGRFKRLEEKLATLQKFKNRQKRQITKLKGINKDVYYKKINNSQSQNAVRAVIGEAQQVSEQRELKAKAQAAAKAKAEAAAKAKAEAAAKAKAEANEFQNASDQLPNANENANSQSVKSTSSMKKGGSFQMKQQKSFKRTGTRKDIKERVRKKIK